MRLILAIVVFAFSTPVWADDDNTLIDEVVYVEAPTDTDGDGRLDRIYTKVSRSSGGRNLPVIFKISPYNLGGNNPAFHNVNVDRLPQDGDADIDQEHLSFIRKQNEVHTELVEDALNRGYATVTSDSVGTGRSTGCPTVGDQSETLAAKAVIDWLNGRARAFDSRGREVTASWASGSVGMIGVSYNGTLPNMVATTGVEGLNAIIPIAAISNWYNYYRSNGLVVGPGGYVGEDADILGKYVVRRNACSAEMRALTSAQGREHGDYTPFWAARDYLPGAENVTAAVFVVHGQSDWNVRQRHAIEWWEALPESTPKCMWLHRGGHSAPSRSSYERKKWAWFDRYVKGVDNGVEDEPAVEVQYPNGQWVAQEQWPAESTERTTLYLNSNWGLNAEPAPAELASFEDRGRSLRVSSLVANPGSRSANRLAFLSEPLASATTLSGTPRVTLNVAVTNRQAANLTVVVVDYDERNRGTVVTYGWADPQNHADIRQGELLIQDQYYNVSFDIEPKQYVLAAGHKLGVVVLATDYEHTLRPTNGTELSVELGPASFIELDLSGSALK